MQGDDGKPSSADERYLRRLLAARVGMPHTYYDDGEAQGQEHGIQIDFLREPVADIDAKLRALNVARASLPTSGVPWDLICQAVEKADDITMTADYMLDSKECIQVLRTMQVLVEIAAPQPAAARVGLIPLAMFHDWIKRRLKACGPEGVTDPVTFAEEAMRWTESAHGIASPQEDGGTA